MHCTFSLVHRTTTKRRSICPSRLSLVSDKRTSVISNPDLPFFEAGRMCINYAKSVKCNLNAVKTAIEIYGH